MLSAQSKYALRAIMYLTEFPSDEFVQVKKIAKKTLLPSAYLSKIVKLLAADKLLISRRGKNGGIRINPKKTPITFYDVCAAMNDPLVQDECVLHKKPCNKLQPCMFHGEWSCTKLRFLDFLKITSVS